MTRDEWARRFMITSVRGRVYTRPMLRALVMRTAMMAALGKHRDYVDVVLDDLDWMHRKHGQTPTSVAHDVEREAWNRWYDAGGR